MREISAGGVVFRRIDGVVDIQLIQDRYGKISLPKGKMEQGETVEQTALREIVEETGIIGEIVTLLEVIKYRYTLPIYGEVDKEVYYYLVEAKSGELQAQIEEIRGVEWCSPEKAYRLQKSRGYANNGSVVEKALKHLGVYNGGIDQ